MKNKCGIASGSIGIIVSILIMLIGAACVGIIVTDYQGLWSDLVINPSLDTTPQPESLGVFGQVIDKMSELVISVPANARVALATPIIGIGFIFMMLNIFCIKRTKKIKSIYISLALIELIVSLAVVGIAAYLAVMGTAIIPWLAVAFAIGAFGIVIASVRFAAFDYEVKATKLAKTISKEKAAMIQRLKNPATATAKNGNTLSKPIPVRNTMIQQEQKMAEVADVSKKKKRNKKK